MHIGPTPPGDAGQNARSSIEGGFRTFMWGIVIIGILVAVWVGWIVAFDDDPPESESSIGPDTAITLSIAIA